MASNENRDNPSGLIRENVKNEWNLFEKRLIMSGVRVSICFMVASVFFSFFLWSAIDFFFYNAAMFPIFLCFTVVIVISLAIITAYLYISQPTIHGTAGYVPFGRYLMSKLSIFNSSASLVSAFLLDARYERDRKAYFCELNSFIDKRRVLHRNFSNEISDLKTQMSKFVPKEKCLVSVATGEEEVVVRYDCSYQCSCGNSFYLETDHEYPEEKCFRCKFYLEPETCVAVTIFYCETCDSRWKSRRRAKRLRCRTCWNDVWCEKNYVETVHNFEHLRESDTPKSIQRVLERLPAFPELFRRVITRYKVSASVLDADVEGWIRENENGGIWAFDDDGKDIYSRMELQDFRTISGRLWCDDVRREWEREVKRNVTKIEVLLDDYLLKEEDYRTYNRLRRQVEETIEMEKMVEALVECSICMERPTTLTLECGHQLCESCFGKIERVANAENRVCPFCRKVTINRRTTRRDAVGAHKEICQSCTKRKNALMLLPCRHRSCERCGAGVIGRKCPASECRKIVKSLKKVFV